MKESSTCILCGFRCSQIDPRTGSRLLEEGEREFYFNTQPIKDCPERKLILRGASNNKARNKVIKGERIS